MGKLNYRSLRRGGNGWCRTAEAELEAAVLKVQKMIDAKETAEVGSCFFDKFRREEEDILTNIRLFVGSLSILVIDYIEYDWITRSSTKFNARVIFIGSYHRSSRS